MDLLCKMHCEGRTGELSGTADELAQSARCEPGEFIDAARELKEKQAALVRFDGKLFYIRNRRMYRAAERRKYNATKQKEYREHARVHPIVEAFERFWLVFPSIRKTKKPDALEAFRKAAEKIDVETIIKAAAEYAASEQGRSKFCRGPVPWLNQQAWLDDREAWRDLDSKSPDAKPFRQVTREEFLEAVNAKSFSSLTRATSDPCWVSGVLSDGSKIECRNYWPPKKSGEATQ